MHAHGKPYNQQCDCFSIETKPTILLRKHNWNSNCS